MEDKQYCVYKHVSPNGKIYIGQTCQKPEKRWMRGLGYKAHPHFYNAIQKYGWDNFEHVIIVTGLTKKEADWCEKYLIAYYESMNPLKGYNHTKGGEGIVGFKMSDETKRKMSESAKGKIVSEETRKKLSESLKGNKCGLGHTLSEEARQKVAESNRRRVISEETRRKISEAAKRRTYSEEERRKRSENKKLYWERKKEQQKLA